MSLIYIPPFPCTRRNRERINRKRSRDDPSIIDYAPRIPPPFLLFQESSRPRGRKPRGRTDLWASAQGLHPDRTIRQNRNPPLTHRNLRHLLITPAPAPTAPMARNATSRSSRRPLPGFGRFDSTRSCEGLMSTPIKLYGSRFGPTTDAMRSERGRPSAKCGVTQYVGRSESNPDRFSPRHRR